MLSTFNSEDLNRGFFAQDCFEPTYRQCAKMSRNPSKNTVVSALQKAGKVNGSSTL